MTSDQSSSSLHDRVTATVQQLRKLVPVELAQPKVAIICGSGLGGLADTIEKDAPSITFSYEDVDGLPQSTVPGHEGKLVFGMLSPQRVPTVLFVGRAHFYEGHSMEMVTYATRLSKRLDVETIIVTNAAGGLNPDYAVGDIMLLNDHINVPGLTGTNPLMGPNEALFGPRFPPLSDAYDLWFRKLAHSVWDQLQQTGSVKRRLHEGVYVFVSGPSYETRAEARFLRGAGADVVGMSTVPEVVVARHSDMRVLALSLVTNSVVIKPTPRGDDPAISSMTEGEVQAYLGQGKASHEEVIAAGKEAAVDLVTFVREIVGRLAPRA